MAKERIVLAVIYNNWDRYWIMASTDIEKCQNFEGYYPGVEYTPHNGVAAVYGTSERAVRLEECNRTIFMPNGTARKAADVLIDRLNELNGGKPVTVFKIN